MHGAYNRRYSEQIQLSHRLKVNLMSVKIYDERMKKLALYVSMILLIPVFFAFLQKYKKFSDNSVARQPINSYSETSTAIDEITF